MKHTVIGVFNTYAEARRAEDALFDAGFQRSDITVHAIRTDNSAAVGQTAPLSEGTHVGYPGAGLDANTGAFPTEPLDAGLTSPLSRDAETAHGMATADDQGTWARIEQFFANLFGSRMHPPEIAHYRQALRRGAALVSVEALSEAQVDVARETMIRTGAIDLEKRIAQWRDTDRGASDTATAGADEPAAFPAPPEGGAVPTDRTHSPMDELGLTDPLSAYYGKEQYDPATDARNARAVRSYARDHDEDTGWHRLMETVRHGWDRLTGHR